MTDGTADLLVRAAIEALPAVVHGIKSLFTRTNPDLPEPTDAEVFAAFNEAYASSLRLDDAWLAAHPPTPSTEP